MTTSKNSLKSPHFYLLFYQKNHTIISKTFVLRDDLLMITAGVVRTLLIVDMVGMALLALFYLRQRRMTLVSYCGWGLLALLVPVIGPFLLISTRPGEMDPTASVFNDIRRLVLFIWRQILGLWRFLVQLQLDKQIQRLVSFLRRLLPEQPPQTKTKLTRLEKARMRRNKRREP